MMLVKAWVKGAVAGLIWGLLAVAFQLVVIPKIGMLKPGESPPPGYFPFLAFVGFLIFAPLHLLNTILSVCFHLDSLYFLFPIFGALMGAFVGYFVDKIRLLLAHK